MPAGGVIDRFLISLGVISDSSGLDEFKKKADEATSSLLAIGTAVTAVVTGMMAKSVAKLGSEMEQNRIQIGGFLGALGIVGQEGDTAGQKFNAGLAQADDTIQSIIRSAALLPGEAQEYIDVFKAGLPYVKQALPGGSLKEMTDFLNQATAIGKSVAPNIDARLMGIDLGHMLTPGKGAAVTRMPFFQGLLPFMQQVEGHAKLTVHEFNQMGSPERLKLMQAAFVKMQPMLDAQANTWEAVKGSIESTVKLLFLKATAPLFEGMKKALTYINGLLYKTDGTFTKLGYRISSFGERASKIIVQVARAVGSLSEWLLSSDAVIGVLTTTIGLLGVALAGLALERVVSTVGKLLYGFMDLKRLLMGGLFLAIGLIAEDLYVFYQGGDSVTGLLVKKFKPALQLIEAGLYSLIGVLVAAKTASFLAAAGFVTSWSAAFWPILLGIGIVGLLGAAIYELWTHWERVSAFIKENWIALVPLLFTPIGPILGIITAIVALGKNWDDVVTAMSDKWDSFVDGIKKAAGFLDSFGLLPKKAADYFAGLKGSGGKTEDMAGAGVTAPGMDPRRDMPGAPQGSWEAGYAPVAAPGMERQGGATEGPSMVTPEGEAPKGTSLAEWVKGTSFGKLLDKIAPLPAKQAGAEDPNAGLKALIGQGDFASMMGMGMTPAMAGAPGMPPFMLDGKGGGGTTNITHHDEVRIGDVKVDARGAEDPERVGREVKDAMERATRNLQGKKRY